MQLVLTSTGSNAMTVKAARDDGAGYQGEVFVSMDAMERIFGPARKLGDPVWVIRVERDGYADRIVTALVHPHADNGFNPRQNPVQVARWVVTGHDDTSYGPVIRAIRAGLTDAERVNAIGFGPAADDAPLTAAERVAAAYPPPVMGYAMPLAAIFDTGHERYLEGAALRHLYDTDDAVRAHIDARLDGTAGVLVPAAP